MSASQPKRLRFHVMIDSETRQIARRLWDATQLRLFLLLPSFLRWDAWHPIDEARIAAEREITPEELNKSLAELVLHGLVLRNDTPPHTLAPLVGLGQKGVVDGGPGKYRRRNGSVTGCRHRVSIGTCAAVPPRPAPYRLLCV